MMMIMIIMIMIMMMIMIIMIMTVMMIMIMMMMIMIIMIIMIMMLNLTAAILTKLTKQNLRVLIIYICGNLVFLSTRTANGKENSDCIYLRAARPIRHSQHFKLLSNVSVHLPSFPLCSVALFRESQNKDTYSSCGT